MGQELLLGKCGIHGWMVEYNGINGCKNDIGPTLPARETAENLSSCRRLMRTRENQDARAAAAAAALPIGAEIGVHHSGPHPSPTSSRRRFDSGRIRAETNSVHCPRSGQVKQWPTTQSRCSTLRRPHQGVEEGGQGGRILNPRTADQTCQADRTGWTAACRYCKSPMVGGWRLDWSPGRSVSGRMMADRNRRRSNYLESRPSQWGAEAKKIGVGLTCRKQ